MATLEKFKEGMEDAKKELSNLRTMDMPKRNYKERKAQLRTKRTEMRIVALRDLFKDTNFQTAFVILTAMMMVGSVVLGLNLISRSLPFEPDPPATIAELYDGCIERIKEGWEKEKQQMRFSACELILEQAS